MGRDPVHEHWHPSPTSGIQSLLASHPLFVISWVFYWTCAFIPFASSLPFDLPLFFIASEQVLLTVLQFSNFLFTGTNLPILMFFNIPT